MIRLSTVREVPGSIPSSDKDFLFAFLKCCYCVFTFFVKILLLCNLTLFSIIKILHNWNLKFISKDYKYENVVKS